MARFLKWRVGMKLWLLALSVPLIAASVAVWLYGLAGGQVNLSSIGWLPAVLSLRFVFAMSAEGIGGEAGWRGFALERLQQRLTPLKASLVVGIFWALCHLPILTIRGFDAGGLGCFTVTVLCLSVILTWFYNITDGSLMIVALVHCLFDAVDAAYSRNFTALVPAEGFMPAFMVVLLAAALILIIRTKGHLGLYEVSQTE
jgi:membrane protease YdiL (CAAX protease family)